MKESWDMDCTEKLEQARFFKEKGTNYFKSAKYSLALRMYKKIVDILDFDSGMYTKVFNANLHVFIASSMKTSINS
jgi:hypothetical protein